LAWDANFVSRKASAYLLGARSELIYLFSYQPQRAMTASRLGRSAFRTLFVEHRHWPLPLLAAAAGSRLPPGNPM